MGIWAILTKDLTPSRADLRWKEPFLYRIRLRGDLAARLMLVASGWMAATAMLLGLFSVSENPGGLDIAVGAVVTLVVSGVMLVAAAVAAFGWGRSGGARRWCG